MTFGHKPVYFGGKKFGIFALRTVIFASELLECILVSEVEHLEDIFQQPAKIK